MSPFPLPQLTAKAIVLGIVLSMILAGANAYLGLFAGLTVSASIPAAVISMAVLRMFSRSNILENNIVQTAASAGESLAAGVIFTIPALVVMGYWEVFQYWWVSAIALVGGLLGVLFTIPLRRSLIVEEGLTFPEGKATAEVLRVGEDPKQGVVLLGLAALAGGLVKLSETGLRLWSATAQSAGYVGNGVIAYVGSNLSPALLGVGYIVGLNIAMLVFIGGAISWYVAIPLYGLLYPDEVARLAADSTATDAAFALWSSKIRYLGVGAMITGGIWALISMRKSLVSGVKSGLAQYAHLRDGGARPADTELDAPMNLVLIGVAVLIVPLFLIYQIATGSIWVSVPMSLVMLVAGFLFCSVAAYMAGLVGSSNNPISGVTIATILLTSLMLVGLHKALPGVTIVPAAAILVGAVVACAAAIGGDNMQDLKTGHIVGATPWKQQLMQAVGVSSAVLVMAPILNLLHQAYGIGTRELPAPQAQLMASVADGVFGTGLPWGMVSIGAVIGVAIIAIDQWLKKRGSKWHAPVLAVAVGIYLPLELAVPILAGGLVAHFAERALKRRFGEAETEARMRKGTLLAAGLITGEALIGIVMAVPIVASGNRDVLAVAAEPLGGLPGVVILAAIAFWLFRAARAGES